MCHFARQSLQFYNTLSKTVSSCVKALLSKSSTSPTAPTDYHNNRQEALQDRLSSKPTEPWRTQPRGTETEAAPACGWWVLHTSRNELATRRASRCTTQVTRTANDTGSFGRSHHTPPPVNEWVDSPSPRYLAPCTQLAFSGRRCWDDAGYDPDRRHGRNWYSSPLLPGKARFSNGCAAR